MVDAAHDESYYISAPWSPHHRRKIRTRRNHDPDEVHQEVVAPEIQELGAAVHDTLVVVVEHAGRIVQNAAVNLACRDDDLEGVA